ncbi:ImmA/IrrE family metallo-endopeptidase [Phytopseudomonas dryadis]|uniref:Uncharacterized protein n=1 Tax=Phytopseudomonas dryadis TaxID=2487520 RepID=A0A4Q9QXV9_9GAMM|nr:hypothetical protein [Pseudomonas dryadis]TBU88438.1 hypothetical protein DNK44_18240 [Pseudomonas dryadis]
MQRSWSINTEWASLESGSPEERAAFATLGISAFGTSLTAGHDRLLQSLRTAPFLSAYHFAEWLAWNWWRLRWEPRKSSTEWELSHSVASIGNGYIWPNIHILSDGQSITLVSKPTPDRERTPYRYISDAVSFISTADFENEVDRFIETVLRRLEDCQVTESNLADIWRAVLEERLDEGLSRQRKLEALLGEDPGEVDETLIQRLLVDATLTGQDALEEIAANRMPGRAVPDIGQLIQMTRTHGTDTDPRDRVQLGSNAFTAPSSMPAWKVGVHAAQALREQLHLNPDDPIPNAKLAELYGAPSDLLDDPAGSSPPPDLSLALTESAGSSEHSTVLLRSKWETGRRFELARLLGDHLTHDTHEPMRPATRSSTYRQKVQRAFAAELLSPFRAVDEMLAGDYSMESQQDVAHHFEVSDWTVRALLVSHGRIDRSELDEIDGPSLSNSPIAHTA